MVWPRAFSHQLTWWDSSTKPDTDELIQFVGIVQWPWHKCLPTQVTCLALSVWGSKMQQVGKESMLLNGEHHVECGHITLAVMDFLASHCALTLRAGVLVTSVPDRSTLPWALLPCPSSRVAWFGLNIAFGSNWKLGPRVKENKTSCGQLKRLVRQRYQFYSDYKCSQNVTHRVPIASFPELTFPPTIRTYMRVVSFWGGSPPSSNGSGENGKDEDEFSMLSSSSHYHQLHNCPTGGSPGKWGCIFPLDIPMAARTKSI